MHVNMCLWSCCALLTCEYHRSYILTHVQVMKKKRQSQHVTLTAPCKRRPLSPAGVMRISPVSHTAVMTRSGLGRYGL